MQLLALPGDEPSLLDGHRCRRRDAVQDAGVGHLLDQVNDVVKTADKERDVLPVDGRDERRLQLLTDAVAHLVAAVLELTQLGGQPLALPVVGKQLLEHSRGRQHIGRVLDEHVEELLFAGNEGEAHDFRLLSR